MLTRKKPRAQRHGKIHGLLLLAALWSLFLPAGAQAERAASAPPGKQEQGVPSREIPPKRTPAKEAPATKKKPTPSPSPPVKQPPVLPKKPPSQPARSEALRSPRSTGRSGQANSKPTAPTTSDSTAKEKAIAKRSSGRSKPSKAKAKTKAKRSSKAKRPARTSTTRKRKRRRARLRRRKRRRKRRRSHAHRSAAAMAKAHAKRARKKPVGPTTTFPKDYESAPSYRYANMNNEACLAELKRRGIDFQRVEKARGVRAPVRLGGLLGKVRYRTLLPEARRKTTPYEVYDCRLVLAMHDMSAILRRHRVDEVIIFSAWRPPGKRWPEKRFARRHPGALALDIMRLRQTIGSTSSQQAGAAKAAGSDAQATAARDKSHWLDITKDFHGYIGDPTCGPQSGPRVRTKKSLALRAIVCEMAAARIFSSILSPHFDAAHFNHLHLEVTPKVKWRILR